MLLSQAEREKRAQVYEAKYGESRDAAGRCFQSGYYRAVCNRCWYAVMQAITAGTYRYLDERKWPPLEEGRDTWPHYKQVNLFDRLIKDYKKYASYEWLEKEIKTLMEWREEADYRAPESVTREKAEKAQKVAEAVIKAMENLACR